MRKRLNDEEAIYLGFEIIEKDSDGKNHRYNITDADLEKLLDYKDSEKITIEPKEQPFVLSAWSDKGRMMDIDEYCEVYNLPRVDIHSYKLISHTGTPYYNIQFKDRISFIDQIDYSFIDDIVRKHIYKHEIEIVGEELNTFDRLVYSDTHIGMNTNGSGNAMYSVSWGKEEQSNRLVSMCSYVGKESKGGLLIIDDLGDFLDGWNGETTRGGHKLPQNMSNTEMFDNGLDFKIKMIDYLVDFYDEIIVNNICEDNHSGDFGYVLNSSFKSIIEQKYETVNVINHRSFISHYLVGKHCFVISHGKDSRSLKFGFKPHLDSKQIEKIDQYIKQNNIYKVSSFIEFSKGDSHQMIFDLATSDDFDYCNYPPFSPSSEWVQTNFKKGRSGFVLSRIDYNSNIKNIKPYFF